MPGVKRTSKARGRKKAAVTALGLAGALSLAGSAAASTVPNGGVPALKAAPVMLAEEEISDVSLATFYVFDKDNIAPAGIKLAAKGGVARAAEARAVEGLRRQRVRGARLPGLRPRRL